jgi:hypothetical protein
MAATLRRMQDEDVRAIFEYLHQKAPPPVHLKFKIVPVGPGEALSPPEFEFAGMNIFNLEYVNLSCVLLGCISHSLA